MKQISSHPLHQPVLYQQVIGILQPRTAGKYVDGTVGGGGHAAGILESSQPGGLLLALDVDSSALQIAREHLADFQERVFFRHGSYADLAGHLASVGWDRVDGIILDLGISSMQLDTAERGFSFLKDAPLDMRLNTSQEKTAADLVNQLDQGKLERILQQYGEERHSRRIAAAIIAQRPITTTLQLAKVIEQAIGQRREKIHAATRSFQALRIAVNQELSALEKGLPQVIDALASGGRLAVISFHSLEDRLVKQFFQRESQGCLCPPEQPFCTCGHRASLKILTKKVIKPSTEETERNPRARSAKLRAVEKM